MKRILLSVFALFFFAIQTLSAQQHVKKDGTPDMRYKENKSTYSTPSYSSPTYSSPTYSTPSTTHLKKDGTPDMRYKENNTTYSSPSYSTQSHTTSTSNHSYAYGVKRDSHGRIARSSSVKLEFMKESGYPHGRPGYVVDHIKPLKEGGCDCPSNMQWQTIADAKAKDK